MIFLIVSILYSVLMIFACVKSEKPLKGNPVIIIGSILVLLTNIRMVLETPLAIIPLLVGIILIHTGAIMNGKELHGKINLRHHMVRGIFSVILLVLYFL